MFSIKYFTEYPVCLLSEFVCDNKLCIPLDYVCDSDDDCRDGSDEQNCPDLCDAATQVMSQAVTSG